MPPGVNGMGGAKRKRDNRTFSQDSGADGPGRPSPHRPNDLPSANRGGYGQPYGQQNQQYSQQQGGGYGNAPNGQVRGGGRRGGRGGRGGGFPNAGNGGYAAPSNGSSGRGGFRGDTGNGHADANAIPVAPTPNRPSTANDSSTQATPVRPAEPQPATPTTVIPAKPAPAPRQAPAPKPKPPRPVLQYDYEVLTEECVQNFSNSGKDAVLLAASEAFRDEDIMAISTVFQELINAALDNRLDPSAAGGCVKQIIENAPSDGMVDPATLFLDTLSTITEPDYDYPRARPLVVATGISPSLIREILDDQLLQSTQLVRQTFKKMFIRQQTNRLYRQSNYNLLREETEGFSKLLTELFTTSMNEPPTAEVVEDTFENIKALVGSFDLDAGRVLDVILDAFASLLVKHYRFFVKLLRTSSWWPQEQTSADSSASIGGLPPWAEPEHSGWTLAEDERGRLAEARQARDTDFWSKAKSSGMDAWFGLGGATTLSEEEVVQAVASAASSGVSADVDEKDQNARIAETQKWIQETKTLPPSGNAVAAQLLGFKLHFYASSARDTQDTLPVNLIYLSALLIKIGFISLRDLYVHLWPEDIAMEKVREKQIKEKEEREAARRPGGGVLNALARAGALADDTMPAPVTRLREAERGTTKSDPASTSVTPAPDSKEEEKEAELPEPSDQKVQLLRSLLCIGAIPEALYLLGRYTWLPDLFPDLPEHLHRILHHSLSKIYDECQPLRNRDSVREAAPQPEDKQKENSLPLKADLRMQDAQAQRVLRWAQLDKTDTGDGTDYRFYWDDWSDNVPVCQSVDDIFVLCNTFMNYSGVKIGQDGGLLLKLARIGKQSLLNDFSGPNKARWLDLCKRLLCPALSMTRANPGLVNEVFDILKMFDTKTRYSIYAEWFTGPTSRVPDVAAAFALVTAETKDILKRMSKTNMKPMARALAKIACASPGITFAVVLNQIESYENLIDVVVDCGRYFTYMGYDVLTWCIMTTLGRAGRSRVGADGITTSSWLTSLSFFTGKVYKRYQIMSSLPILQYVLHQLGQGNFTDLRVLRELIVSMAGIAPDTDFSEAQIQAMAGGQLLQAATLRQLQDKRHESKVTAKRFIKTMMDHGLVGPLLISIAQQRQRCIFNPDQMNLKIIGENFDDIHIGMTQFLEMVRTNLRVEEFNAVVPDVAELIAEYGLDPSVAFTIFRRSIAKAMDEYDALHPSTTKKGIRRTSSNKPPPPADIEMTDATISEVIEASDTIENAKDEVVLASSDSPPKIDDIVIDSFSQTPWHPVLQTLMEKLRPTMSEKFLSSMSLAFFTTFWQLSLHDLMAPAKSYGDEDVRQKERIAAINADRTDVTALGARKKEQEKRAIVDFREGLLKEMKEHMSNYTDVRSRLEKEKKHWFKDFKGQYKALNDALLQECFLPRLLISPLDSYFAWKMLNLLHSSGTPEFRTMHFLDRLFGERMLANLIFHCTAREAECLGRFLNEVLQELTAWHGSKVIYEKRAWGPKKELSGFAEKPAFGDESAVFVQYEDFRRLLSKWHQQLTAALMDCFGGNKEYMHIKNGIVVLRCVCKYFPAINWQGTRLYTKVEDLSKSEKNVRPDIWVASSSLLGNLKAREKAWVLPQAFSVAKQKAVTRPSTATPQPGTPSNGTVANLNATASEFVPKTSVASSGDKTQAAGKKDAEDGEVEDVAMSGTGTKADVVVIDQGKPNVVNPGLAASAAADTRSTTPANITRPSTATQNRAGPTTAPSMPSAQTTAPRATPQPSSNPPRPELSRNPSSSRPPPREQHNLPNRPDAARPSRGHDRDTLPGRPNGPTDYSRQPGPQGRFDRASDQSQQGRPDRRNRSPPPARSVRDLRADGPSSHEDGLGRASSRDVRSRETSRSARDTEPLRRDEPRTAPSRSQTATPLHASQANSQQVPVNPARAAMIQQNEIVDLSGESTRPGRRSDDTRSPRSAVSDTERHEPHPDRRRAAQADDRQPGQRGTERSFPPAATPSGPRRTSVGSFTDDQSRRNVPHQTQAQSRDLGHGRLAQDPPQRGRGARQQDESYGRLNSGTTTPPGYPSANDIPVNTDRRRVNDDPPGIDNQSRMPPPGPGGNRQDRPPSGPASTVAQFAPIDRPVMHPSRQSSAQSVPTQPNGISARPAPITITDTPSGPRAGHQRRQSGQFGGVPPANLPAAQTPTRGPPTGPSANNNDRRFAGLNGTLQQGGQQTPVRSTFDASSNDLGASIRGRANRSSVQGGQAGLQQPSSVAVQAATPTRQPLPPQEQVMRQPPPPQERISQQRPPLPPQEHVMQNSRQRPAIPPPPPPPQEEPRSVRETDRGRNDRPNERDHDIRDRDRRPLPPQGRDQSFRETRSTRSRDGIEPLVVPPPRSAMDTRGDRSANDREGDRERDSRRTRDRGHAPLPPQSIAVASSTQQAPPPPRDAYAPNNAGRDIRPRGGGPDRDSRDGRGPERDLMAGDRHHDSNSRNDTRTPARVDDAPARYQQPQQSSAPYSATRPAMPPQEELFSNASNNRFGGPQDRRGAPSGDRGGGSMGGGGRDVMDGRDGRFDGRNKRPYDGPGGPDDGKRARRGGR